MGKVLNGGFHFNDFNGGSPSHSHHPFRTMGFSLGKTIQLLGVAPWPMEASGDFPRSEPEAALLRRRTKKLRKVGIPWVELMCSPLGKWPTKDDDDDDDDDDNADDDDAAAAADDDDDDGRHSSAIQYISTSLCSQQIFGQQWLTPDGLSWVRHIVMTFWTIWQFRIHVAGPGYIPVAGPGPWTLACHELGVGNDEPDKPQECKLDWLMCYFWVIYFLKLPPMCGDDAPWTIIRELGTCWNRQPAGSVMIQSWGNQCLRHRPSFHPQT